MADLVDVSPKRCRPSVADGQLTADSSLPAAQGLREALTEVFRHESVNYWVDAAATLKTSTWVQLPTSTFQNINMGSSVN